MDLAQKIDVFVLSNNAASKRGLLNVTGLNSVTFTTPVTVPGFYPKVADALNQVQTGRFLSAEKWIMHPRRWNWMLGTGGTEGGTGRLPFCGHRPRLRPNATAPTPEGAGAVACRVPHLCERRAGPDTDTAYGTRGRYPGDEDHSTE